MNKLRTLCARKGALWAVNASDRFTCTKFKRIHGVNEENFELTLASTADPNKAGPYPILFSTEKNSSKSFSLRDLSDEEKHRLRAILMKKAALYKGAISALDENKARVAILGDAMVFLIPWYIDRQGEYSINDVSIVATMNSGAIGIRGTVTGDVKGVYSLAGVAHPALLVSFDCDGRCEYLYTTNSLDQPLVAVSVH